MLLEIDPREEEDTGRGRGRCRDKSPFETASGIRAGSAAERITCVARVSTGHGFSARGSKGPSGTARGRFEGDARGSVDRGNREYLGVFCGLENVNEERESPAAFLKSSAELLGVGPGGEKLGGGPGLLKAPDLGLLVTAALTETMRWPSLQQMSKDRALSSSAAV